MPNGYFKVLTMVNLITANSLFYFALEFQTNFKTKVKIETQTITFDQLPHVVSGLSEKLDRVLEILEKVGIANPHQKCQTLPQTRVCERGLPDNRQVTLEPLPWHQSSE